MLEVSVTTLLLPLPAYILGSIPFGLILAKLFGRTDVRKGGSGNIGATNVARVAGPVAGILTLILDVAKGSAAVLLAALAGHCFPIWLKFKGGKGVATAAGMFLVLCPLAFLGSVILFVLVVAFWRYVSLGSISAAAAMPLLMYFFWAPRHAPPLVITFGSLAAAVLIVCKHAGNIRRLAQGVEPKFSFGKTKDTG